MSIKKLSKRQLAYELIKKRIVDGSYATGKRIVIDQMAKALGSSAIPVREAIHQLESEQLSEQWTIPSTKKPLKPSPLYSDVH